MVRSSFLIHSFVYKCLPSSQILVHITKPWKTFRNVQPPNYILQNILQYRFDQGGRSHRQRRDSGVLVHGSRERNVAIQVRADVGKEELKSALFEEGASIYDVRTEGGGGVSLKKM